MKISRKFIYNIFFILYMPGFLIYHYLAIYNIIPTFLGGYLGYMSLILFIPISLTIVDFKNLMIKLSVKTDFLFFLFLFYFLIIILFNLSNGANKLIVKQHLAVVIEFYVLYLIFRDFNYNSRSIYIISFLIPFILLIFTFNTNRLFAGVTGEYATYQSISLMLSIIGIYLISKINIFIFRIFVYTTMTLLLYYLGSRFEFLLFCVIIYCAELYFSRHKVLFIFISIVFILFIIHYCVNLIYLLPDSRIKKSFFLALLNNNSLHDIFYHRFLLFENGIDIIFNNPIVGKYAYYEPGKYIHGILSTWADLGLFGFILILFLILNPLIFIFRIIFIEKKICDICLFLLLLSIFVNLSLFITKNYFYIGIPVLRGVFVNVSMNCTNWKKQ